MKNSLLTILLLITMPTFANDHLITQTSPHTVAETTNKLVAAIAAKGLTLFAQIDHTKNAQTVDLELAPSQVILFGNPQAGTVLMQCAPTVAIDLPLKMLVWQDSDQQTHLAYINPAYLKELHSIDNCDPVLEKITGLLAGLASTASMP